MNNTDKLLRAFIEASGYEIEETIGNPTSNDPKIQFYLNFDYKVTKTKLQQVLDDNILSIPNSRKLTKECIEDLINPNKPVGGVIVLRYEDEE